MNMGPISSLRIFIHPPVPNDAPPILSPFNPTPKFDVKIGKGDTLNYVNDYCGLGESQITRVRLPQLCVWLIEWGVIGRRDYHGSSQLDRSDLAPHYSSHKKL